MSCYKEAYASFCTSAESLLQIMQTEKQHLKNTHLSKLDSLLQEKNEFFASNSRDAAQLLDQDNWEQLDKSQQQTIFCYLKAIAEGAQANIDQLAISNRGNKKLMEICFNKIKADPVAYLANAKLFKVSNIPSVGIRQMV